MFERWRCSTVNWGASSFMMSYILVTNWTLLQVRVHKAERWSLIMERERERRERERERENESERQREGRRRLARELEV